MKIKILVVSIITILIVGIIVGLSGEKKGNVNKPLDINNSSKIIEEQKKENDLKEKEDDDVIFSDSEEKEELSNPPKVEKEEDSKPTKEEEQKETKPVIKEESKPSVKEEPKVETVKPPVSKPDPVVPEVKEPEEEIDYGYIEAMKEVEYLTEQECFDAGMEKSFSDADNVIGFDVRELYYGGKIIGYKLILRYENPME